MLEFQTFSTERLLLRLLTPELLTELFRTHPESEIRALIGDVEYEKQLPRVPGGLASWDRSFHFFQLVEKESGAIMGGCGFHNWFAFHRRAELVYFLDRDEYKQKGYMKEALGFVLHYGFTKLNLNRVEALIAAENTPSLKLLQHYGFTREGVLREHYNIGEVLDDSVFYALLRREYDERRISY